MNDERIHTLDNAGLRLIEALKAYIPIVMRKHQTPGLQIALADKGRMIWEAGYGLNDITTGKEMTSDSVYRSGSLGKTYTATAIMILVDRGIIALDDPINKHLPFKVRNPLGERDITVLDLMVHRAGLSVDGACSWQPAVDLAATVKAEYDRECSPLMGGMMKRWISPVGAQWMYSNLGISTLGLIVQTANLEGLSFSDFVQRHVMDPLGMTHSQYPPAQHPDYVRPDIWALTGKGYSRMGGADVPTIPLYISEYPSGAALQRPADHLRLLLAMLNDGELEGCRLFSPEIACAMLSPATPSPDERQGSVNSRNNEQGLVWRINDHGTEWESFDHAGGHMFGWRTQGRGWRNYGAAVMVAVNQWNLPESVFDVNELTDFVGNWLRHRPPVDADEPMAWDAGVVSYVRGVLLAGTYRVSLAIEGQIPKEVFNVDFAAVRDRLGSWDLDAFRRGFETASALPQTVDAIKSFWKSPECEVDGATAHSVYVALGGRPEPGLVSILLPDREAPG